MSDSNKMARNKLRNSLIEYFPRRRESLLPILHYLQHTYGYLPGWALEVVGWHLGVPASEVYGAATTYTELRLDEPQEGEVIVCTGLTCRQNGGRDMLDFLDNVKEGVEKTTCTVKTVPCAFICAVGPVAKRKDGKWHGRMSLSDLRLMLS